MAIHPMKRWIESSLIAMGIIAGLGVMSKRKRRLRPDSFATRLLAAIIIYPVILFFSLKKKILQ
jgi:hypothetical protein